MGVDNSKKISILKTWEILSTETDEFHPMSSVTLMKRLKENGIEVTRLTLYKDIEMLNENGYEVLCTRSTSNQYYVRKRTFNNAEVQILMDAVQASNFITQAKTEALIDKLSLLPGREHGKVLKEHIIWCGSPKCDNENVYQSVELISQAITDNKKISFLYFDYGVRHEKCYRKNSTKPTEDKIYVVNPVATAVHDDKYYLICFDDKHKNLTQYRVDRMDKMTILSTDRTPNPEVDNINIADYKKTLIGMFTGETKKVLFEADKSILGAIYDKFGSDIQFTQKRSGKVAFSVNVQISNPFLLWVAGFGSKLKLISPMSIKKSLISYLQEALEN